MKSVARILFSCVAATVLSRAPGAAPLAARSQSPPPQLRALGPSAVITDADCSTTKLGGSVPVSSIGEPVSGVEVATLRWITAAGSTPAYCAVDGSMAPVDPGAPPINFRVLLPAEWSHRAAQLGGGGINGTIPNLTGNEFPIGGSSALSSASRPTAATPAIRAARSAAAARLPEYRRLDAERRGDQEPRLHADEEDARRRDGAHRARLRRAAAIQLLHRHARRAAAKR